MNAPHLTTIDLAKRWNMTLHTLAQWRWSGRGPQFLKVGGSVRYRQEDIIDFETNQLFQNTSQLNYKTTQLRRLQLETLPNLTPLRKNCP